MHIQSIVGLKRSGKNVLSANASVESPIWFGGVDFVDMKRRMYTHEKNRQPQRLKSMGSSKIKAQTQHIITYPTGRYLKGRMMF